MTKFSDQVRITISNFEHQVVYYDLALNQKMMDHHHFSFIWQYTGKAVIKPVDQAAAIQKYKGQEVIFTFKSLTGIQLMSKGIITGLKSVDVNGSPVGLHVKGKSHSILLDDQKKSRTFLDRSLLDIALNIFSEETAGEFYNREAIQPTVTSFFECIPQYNETSFDFLKRLSARHAQWFYFDGMRIQFGQTKTSKVKLLNGASMHNFGIDTNLESHKTSFAGYDSNKAANITASKAKTTTGSADSFARIAGDRQASVSQPNLSIAAYTNQAKNSDELNEMVRLQTAARDANSVFYSGTSYLPIGVGQVFTIENQTVRHDLIAIEVTHHSKVHSNYSCDFIAIPADVAAPHYTNVEIFVKAESQSAIVKDNNDPEAMGRIKVAFNWGTGSTTSQWMRMTQQYAGNGRGIYFRPEIGDEVLVAFEGGNVDCPYVLATHYNGKAKPEFFNSDNNTKGWKLRFGQLFKFVEKIGIWLSDPSGNEVHLDEGNKNINITSPGTVTIKAEHIVFEATKSITTNAGTDISESVSINKTTNVGGLLQTTVGGDKILNVVGDSHVNIDGNANSEVKKDRNTTSQSKIITQSSLGHQFHSEKNIQNNSAEETKQN